MKTEKHSEKNVTVQLATLKLNLDACETRLANALIYPETRAAVHTSLTGESLDPECSYCEKSDREERMKANLDKTWDYICAECEDLLAEYYNV